MTADERIEGLLNAFGQTIADLPKWDLEDHECKTYKNAMRSCAASACEWASNGEITHDYLMKTAIPDELKQRVLRGYICHLADIIDRMETALETAVRWSSCFTCARFVKEFPKCKAKYDAECYEMNDACLIDNDVEVEDEDS